MRIYKRLLHFIIIVVRQGYAISDTSVTHGDLSVLDWRSGVGENLEEKGFSKPVLV